MSTGKAWDGRVPDPVTLMYSIELQHVIQRKRGIMPVSYSYWTIA